MSDRVKPLQRRIGEISHGLPKRACHALGITPFPGLWLAAHPGEKPSEYVGAAHQFVGKFAHGVHLTTVSSFVVLLFFAEVIPRHFGDEEAHARIHFLGLKRLHQNPHPSCDFGLRSLPLVAYEIAERLQGFWPGVACRTDPADDCFHGVNKSARNETCQVSSKASTGGSCRVVISGCELDKKLDAALDVGECFISRCRIPGSECRT